MTHGDLPRIRFQRKATSSGRIILLTEVIERVDVFFFLFALSRTTTLDQDLKKRLTTHLIPKEEEEGAKKGK